MALPRSIARVVRAVEQEEGDGAIVWRSIGTPKLRDLSPFLLLDHFASSTQGSFPDHPHRGQETITYMIQGESHHEDFTGGKGILRSGDLQFMTAGRGIMHSEIPAPGHDGSPMTGLQIWVDLPTELKYCEPRYRDLRASEIPTVEVDEGKVQVKVISGESHGVESLKELAYTPVWLLDIKIKPGGRIVQKVPERYTAFAYTLSGTTCFEGNYGGATSSEEKISPRFGPYHNVIFEKTGDCIIAGVPSDTKETGNFILAAGPPLDQEVVRYGPFVLNSQEEIRRVQMRANRLLHRLQRRPHTRDVAIPAHLDPDTRG
ncbi:Pirin [Neofusicoccum parvum]|uniref:Pirin n=1 Tax=Neofusicoccum parvum TaxID=310453 RepID=A0ACB5SC29_9PEZI|nr:Pirin [Neofusicoccum parvum]